MDLDTLGQMRTKFLSDFCDVKSGKDTAGAIDLNKVEEELKAITKAMTKLKTDAPKSVDSTNQFDKTLDKDIRDKVASISMFGPSSDVATFLQQCTVIFDTLVKGNSDDRVEVEFVRKCKLRLDNAYLAALNAHSTSIKTFKEFTDYMDSKHQSKKSAYQYLEAISELEMRPDESYTDFALRTQIEIGRASTIVKNKWAKHILVENSAATEAQKQMSADNVFEVMGGQIVLQQVKRNSAVYNQIINDLDSTWTGLEIANKALSIADRQVKDAPTQPATVHFTQKSEPSREICAKFLAGKCNWEEVSGRKCKYFHDKELQARLSRQSKPKSDPKSSDGRDGHRGKKKTKSKSYQSTGPTSGSTNQSSQPTGDGFTSHHTQLDPSQVMVFQNGPRQ